MSDEQNRPGASADEGAADTADANAAEPRADGEGQETTGGEAAAEAGSAEQRAEEYLRMAQRAQADLINYRRRVDQERDELRTTARVDAAASMLPVLDDFERALAAIPEDERSKSWVQGVLLIERNLRQMVERAGLERIEAEGQPFDPWAHEAVMADEQSEQEPDTVTKVMRAGYRAGGRVIRPAQVVVARGRQA